MSERRITEGGRELRALVTELQTSVPDFCEQHGLDRIQVQRVMNGERWKRISVEFAHSIKQASNNRITYEMFHPSTAIAVPDSSPDVTEDAA